MTASERNYREFCILETLEVQHGVELNYSKRLGVWHVGHFATKFDREVIHNDKSISEVVSTILEAL